MNASHLVRMGKSKAASFVLLMATTGTAMAGAPAGLVSPLRGERPTQNQAGPQVKDRVEELERYLEMLADSESSSSIAPSAYTYTAVSANGNNSFALRSDGVVYAWGYNAYCQLGLGYTSETVAMPTQIPGLTSVKAIAAGGAHTLFLKTDGTVWSVGDDDYGQLGNDSSYADQCSPVKVSGLSGISMISAGFYHNLALDSAGKLYAWGMNSYGQLGTGNTTNSPTPVSVASSMYSISKIAAAGYHSLAIARSSSSSSTNYMYSWGLNSTGQLCLGTTTNTTSPTLVSSLSSVKDVAGGYEASIALVGSSLYTCGGNSAGELGIGTLGGYKSTPQKLPFSVFKSPKSGGLSFYAYDTSLTSAMWGWGWNDSCQLGYNTYGYDVLSPVFASPYFPTTSTGWAHVLYIDSYGQVYAVGENDRGEIGNGQVGADVCYPTRVLLP